MTAALQGVDGLVSTVAGAAIESQALLIDAAVAAGVKRFIPSDFGSVTTSPKLATLPHYGSMFKVRKHLQDKADAGQLTWSVLRPGAFLEFLFGHPTLLDYANHRATIYDDGDNRLSSTSQVNIGKAIVEIFRQPEATKNRILRTSEVILTQNQLLQIAKQLQPDVAWETSSIQTSVLLKQGLAAIEAGDYSMPTVLKLVAGTALAGDVYGAAYDETDNQLLGVREMTADELRTLVASKLV